MNSNRYEMYVAYYQSKGMSADAAARAADIATRPRPKPIKLDGCTCGGIGDTGAHRQGCQWR